MLETIVLTLIRTKADFIKCNMLVVHEHLY